MLPDGFIGCLYGPIAGHRHDSYMLTESRMLEFVEDLMPLDGSNGGDPAYPQSAHLFGGFRNPQPGSPKAEWNTQMSKVREVVEWLFGEIVQNFSYLDFKSNMEIFKEPIAMYYFVVAFLINLHTTLYKNKTATYFECRKEDLLNIEGYLNLLSVEDIVAINLDNGVSFQENMNENFMEQFGHVNVDVNAN